MLNTDAKKKIVYVPAVGQNKFSILKLKLFLMFHKNFEIALDMKFVKDLKEDFIHLLKNVSKDNKLCLFNLNARLMMLLGLRCCDKYVTVYADESDFWHNRRSLVKRKFRVY